MVTEERLVRAQELAQVLDVPVNTIYDRAKKDAWPCYRIGRDVRFNLAEILELLHRQAEAV